MQPSLGYGIGLRPKHFPDFLKQEKPPIDWLEIVSENYMGVGGRCRKILETLRATYPIATHGVGLSIAGSDPLDRRYLQLLRELVHWLQPAMVTDHLCWTSWGGHHTYDLLPFPLNQESLTHIAGRIHQVQDYLGRPMLFENPSCYIDFKSSDLSEPEFLAELCHRTGCGILLDLNNCIVNSRNLGWDPWQYLEKLRPSMVGQFHLAGHSYEAEISIDTHDHEVPEAVWQLFEQAAQRFPAASVLLEWDDNIPELERMQEELATARRRGQPSDRAWPQQLAAKPRNSGLAPEAKSPSLHLTQASFFSAILSFQTPAPFLKDLRPSPAGAQRGVSVYQHGYPQRIIEALKNTFPTLHYILEDELFAATAGLYVEHLQKTRRASSFSINYIGEELAPFLAEVASPYPFGVPQATIAALAAFDWTHYELFIKADCSEPPLHAAELATWSPELWESQRLQLSADATLLQLDWQIYEAWTEIQEGRTPLPPQAGPELCLFKRSGGAISIEKLESDKHAFWHSLQRGAALGELVEVCGEEDAEKAVHLCLQRLLQLAHEGHLRSTV